MNLDVAFHNSEFGRRYIDLPWSWVAIGLGLWLLWKVRRRLTSASTYGLVHRNFRN